MNIIFDATVIANYYENNSSRSGIFFVAKNILDCFLEKSDIHVLFYFNSDNIEQSIRVHEELYPNVPCVQNLEKYNLLIIIKRKLIQIHKKVFSRKFVRKGPAVGIFLLNKILKHTLEIDCKNDLMMNATCFFSPIYKVPGIVRKYPTIRPFVFLHDAIPFLYPGLKCAPFTKEVCETTLKEDVLFYNSKNTRRDIERSYPMLKKCDAYISYLAASKLFVADYNLQRLVNVKGKYGIPKEKRFVFSLCTLEPRKNLIRAVSCFFTFIRKHGISDLVWVMGGGQWDSFVRELEKKGVDWNPEYIIRTGYIDDDDLPVLYSNAEWFVYTSQYEGFGLPPLEAMQCGCPVITSNNSSLPEVVGEAGIMIDWDNDEQHVEAYERYYFNEKIKTENRQRSLERAKLFSWEKTINEIVSVMKNYNGDSK